MDTPPLTAKITDTDKRHCQRLLEAAQSIPADTPFEEGRFETTCSKLRNENEARLIKDMTFLIVASAETLATCGATNLNILFEKLNSSWCKCIPLIRPRPQPDYTGGFRATAFTEAQRNKLRPLVSGDKEECSVMARDDVYFPFLTCEVKCGD